MKYIILVPDGMADFPLDELAGQTPLSHANTPAMDALAQAGIVGEFTPIPDGFPPGSDIGNLSMFGYDPGAAFTGRAPIEAANKGIEIGPDEVCFRCNLVTLRDGVMVNFTAGHISSEEASELIAALNEAFENDPITYYAGVQYRNLCVVKDAVAPLDQLRALETTPPHNISDEPVAGYLPAGAGADVIRGFMTKSQAVLANHPINKRRLENNEPPATSVWLWGQGVAPTIESYRNLFDRTGAVISAVDLVKGIGVCAGLDVIDVKGATGYLDTNYEGKVQAAIDALATRDFVYVHIEAPDETAHEGRTDLKLQAIEDFDERVAAPTWDYACQQGDVRVLVAPDHITALSTKTHAGGPVPFVVAGAGVTGNGLPAYSEFTGKESGLLVDPGYLLIRSFLSGAPLEAGSLGALTAGSAN